MENNTKTQTATSKITQTANPKMSIQEQGYRGSGTVGRVGVVPIGVAIAHQRRRGIKMMRILKIA